MYGGIIGGGTGGGAIGVDGFELEVLSDSFLSGAINSDGGDGNENLLPLLISTGRAFNEYTGLSICGEVPLTACMTASRAELTSEL